MQPIYGLETYLAEGVEYVVKISQDFSFRNLCDVIHRLACVIAHPGILVDETGQYRRHNNLEISR